MTTTLTKTRTLELLERVVGREGATTVRYGVYVEAARPWCIAACVLVEAGASVDDFMGLNHLPLFMLREVGPIVMTSAAQAVLDWAQRVQDSNKTWGEALAAAHACAIGYGGEE